MSFLDEALSHAAMLEQWTLCSVEDVPDDQMAEQPAGLPNHPAWILGHLVGAFDALTRALGQDVARDDAWYERFRQGTKPTSNRSDYPSKDDLIAAYTDACRSLRKAIQAAGESVLDQPVDNEQLAAFFPTNGRWTAHCLLSEGAFHTGQLSAWRRAKGLPSVFDVEANLPRLMASSLVV